ncbi:membrane protein [Pseudomonas aeruginosa]|nr:membrane protein [Pseudomonas aeruginosa]
MKKEQADALVRQAEAEALQAQQARQAVAPAAAVAAVPGEVRVPYIPQVVRDQIRDEVKAEVMTQAKAENWAQPNAFPDWASRISFDGDVRLRYESRSFGNGNSNQITDFAELNDDGPYDVNPNTSSGLPPLLNTREDRDSLLRLRARFGLKAALSESWSAGIRIGTGSDNNPVSTTQTLGGGFGKKDLWLDQGYLTWKPSERLSLTGGRIANPFLSTDLLYSNDLNFDGVAAIFNQPLSRDVALFGTVGAFPVEYSSDTASSNGFDKEDSDNKWMYGAQLGATWKINPQHSLTGALAYYRFDDIEGRRSSPCRPWAGDPECDTDGSRPTFMQKGNTVFLLRDIVPNPADPANTPNPQYVGLASEFQPARPEPRLGCRAAQRLQAAGGRQLRAQPGLRRGRHAQARRRCGADRQQPRLRWRHQERGERLDAPVHPGQRPGHARRRRLAGLRRLQVHPAGCPAGRFQRFHLPPWRDQRQGLHPRRQLWLRQARLRYRALAQLRRGLRRTVLHRRPATRGQHALLSAPRGRP